ncbi:MAG: DUF4838 domain-containing protein [Lentisphaeria bacterium]|nr:DUF4838 domain-containing protein [Lentisphaeria bacterium]
MRFFIILLLTAFLTVNQLSAVMIIVPEQNSRLEKTAKEELVTFIEQACRKKVTVITEKKGMKIPAGKKVIYLGNTDFAAKNNIKQSALAKEEWVLKSVGNDVLVICGGKPAGTLYGVYAFLNKIGVRFFAPDCTVVPQVKKIDFSGMDERKKPVFDGRCVYTAIPSSFAYFRVPRKHFDTFWRWRLRILQNGGHGIPRRNIPDAEYLGEFYNLVVSFHTFSYYVDPKLFDKHPEYFSMDKTGVRRKPKGFSFQGSLCLTNPDVAKVALDSLRKMIKEDRKNKLQEDWATIYDISTLDNTPYICFCPQCDKLAKAENGDAGLVLHFINQIAREIRKEYPEIRIRTFCYSSAKHVPNTIRPESNVLIQYCDEFPVSDCYRPLTSKFNTQMLANIKKWSNSGAKIVLWDYWNMGGRFYDPPRVETVIDAFISDFKTFRDLNVPAFFTENELDMITPQSFIFLQYYLSAILMVDPEADPEKHIAEFIKGYYGDKAAPIVAEYLKEIREGIKSHPTIQQTMRVGGWHFATPKFLLKYYKSFNEIAKTLPENSIYKRHLHTEMIPLLWQVLSLPESTLKKNSLTYDGVLAQLESYSQEFINYYEPAAKNNVKKQYDEKLQTIKTRLPVPPEFADIPSEKRRIYGYPSYRPMPHVHGNKVNDPEALCGVALKGHSPEKGMHGVGKTRSGYVKERNYKWCFATSQIEVECLDNPKTKGIIIKDIPTDEKYHWYTIPKAEISAKTTLWAHMWAIQFELSQAYMLADGIADNNIWDVHVRVKFTGPEWVKGSKKENAIYLDMVVLTRPGTKTKGSVLNID